MATVAGGGGERMLPRRRRMPLGDLTNLSSATSVLTPLKSSARSKLRTSPSASTTSSIGSSTVPRTRCPPLPPPPYVAAVIKGKGKSTRELQSPTCQPKKSKMVSKAKVKTGDMLPGASSPPSKKIRKLTREVLPHIELLDKSSGQALPCQDFIKEQRAYFAEIDAFGKPKVKTGDVLSGASSPPSNKTRKVTREEQLEMEPLDQSSGEPMPSQDFIEERRAYFAEIDAFQLVEEFVSSGSDLE